MLGHGQVPLLFSVQPRSSVIGATGAQEGDLVLTKFSTGD